MGYVIIDFTNSKYKPNTITEAIMLIALKSNITPYQVRKLVKSRPVFLQWNQFRFCLKAKSYPQKQVQDYSNTITGW